MTYERSKVVQQMRADLAAEYRRIRQTNPAMARLLFRSMRRALAEATAAAAKALYSGTNSPHGLRMLLP